MNSSFWGWDTSISSSDGSSGDSVCRWIWWTLVKPAIKDLILRYNQQGLLEKERWDHPSFWKKELCHTKSVQAGSVWRPPAGRWEKWVRRSLTVGCRVNLPLEFKILIQSKDPPWPTLNFRLLTKLLWVQYPSLYCRIYKIYFCLIGARLLRLYITLYIYE